MTDFLTAYADIFVYAGGITFVLAYLMINQAILRLLVILGTTF